MVSLCDVFDLFPKEIPYLFLLTSYLFPDVLHAATHPSILSFQCFRQDQTGVFPNRKVNAPQAGEYQQAVAAVVLQKLRVGRQVQILQILHGTFHDEAQLLIGQALHAQIHAVFGLHAVLEHVKLQRTHNAYDDFFHTGVGYLEDLNGAFGKYLSPVETSIIPYL